MTTKFINCLSHLLVFLGVVSSAPRCTETGWIDHGGYCYYVSNDEANWITAQGVCRNKGAELVSVHSEDENNFLLTQIEKGYLIGLNRNNKDRWSDGSNVDYIARNNHLVTTDDLNQCVIIRSSSSGQEQWLPSSCDDSFNYICKFQINLHQTTPLINIIRYVCPDKFSGKEESEKCFYIGGLKNQPRLTWDDAKKVCSKLSFQTVVQIASVKNSNEQAYLSLLMKGSRVDAWIGLKSYDTQQFPNTWQDKSPVNYTNWYKYLMYEGFLSSLSTDGELCVYYSFHDSGQWKLNNCQSKNAYICETEKVPLLSTADFAVRTTDFRKENSVQHEDVYYLIIEQLVSWSEASLLCQQLGMELVSIHSYSEVDFLVDQTKELVGTKNYWIGLDSIGNGLFRWTDGSAMSYSNWANYSQVVSGLQKEQCVAMNGNNGRWYLVDCSTKPEGYICSISYDDVNKQNVKEDFKLSESNQRLIVIAAIVVSVLVAVGVIMAKLFSIKKNVRNKPNLKELRKA